MSCHFSCSSCLTLSSSFTSCTACPTTATLFAGACFCNSNWDSTCTLNSSMKAVFQIIDTFYGTLFPLVMLLYCLKIRLPLSYRVVVGLQGFGLLIYSNVIYLYFENYYGLKILIKSSGFYNLPYRLQSLSLYYALPAIVLFCCFLVALFLLYYPIKTYKQNYSSYGSYLKQNTFAFLNNFYYFGSRITLYYIGLWISSGSMAISDIVPFSIFSFIIVVVIVKVIYDFHKNKADDGVYEAEIYLYCMMSPLSFVGLPLVSTSTFYLIIYLAPIGFLAMIMLLNKNYEIISKQKIALYLVEIMISALIVVFLIMGDSFKSVIILIAILLGSLIIIIEMAVLYYSGVSLERSNKIHAEQAEIDKEPNQTVQGIQRKKITRVVNKKASYF